MLVGDLIRTLSSMDQDDEVGVATTSISGFVSGIRRVCQADQVLITDEGNVQGVVVLDLAEETLFEEEVGITPL